MMKRLPLVFALILVYSQAHSQEEKLKHIPEFDLKRIHFGFTVGINTMDLAIKRDYDAEDFVYADVSRVLLGFQVSIVSDLRINQNWNLRFLPGISFGSREVDFYTYDANGLGDMVEIKDVDNPVALGPSYLDFPLHLKYRSDRLNNHRPYLVGGLNFRYDMSAKKKYDSDSNEYLKFKPADLYVEFGFGVDNYLKYFKFAPEIKLAVGLFNIIDPDDVRPPHEQFVRSIERATAYIVMLNFHFE
jgi:hypothetical protein